MKIGFTGTRRGMTDAQRNSLRKFLQTAAGEFHHGDCIGADEQAHDIAEAAGFEIHIHPPLNPTKRAFKITHVSRMRPELPYLARNRNIVFATDELVATPAEPEEQLRSGTWSTVRFARTRNRPITIIYPDASFNHC